MVQVDAIDSSGCCTQSIVVIVEEDPRFYLFFPIFTPKTNTSYFDVAHSFIDDKPIAVSITTPFFDGRLWLFRYGSFCLRPYRVISTRLFFFIADHFFISTANQWVILSTVFKTGYIR